MEETYKKIFTRLGLDFRVVEADSGAIGGSGSKEFMVLADSGEDTIVVCESCEYGANIEAAIAKPKEYTKQIEVKTVRMKAFYDEGKSAIVGFVVPLNIALQEVKSCHAIGANELVSCDSTEKFDIVVIEETLGAIVNPSEFVSEEMIYADISSVCEGDTCVHCAGKLRYTKGIEAGHIFQLGTQYSEPLGCNFLDENGKSVPMLMGTYGIGVSRLLAGIIEQNHDDKGCIWTKESAPFSLQIIVSNIKDEAQMALGETLYTQMLENGVDVLLDERKDRYGAKMKDYELIGVPYAVVIGKNLADSKVEFLTRKGMIKEEVDARDISSFLEKKRFEGKF